MQKAMGSIIPEPKQTTKPQTRKQLYVGENTEISELFYSAFANVQLYIQSLYGSSSNIKNRMTMWLRSALLGTHPKEYKARPETSCLYIYIHSTITHNSQNGRATYMIMDRFMDKQNVYVSMCMYMHVHTHVSKDHLCTGQRLMSDVFLKHTNLAGLAGQQIPVIHLSLPTQYWEIGTSGFLYACWGSEFRNA